MSELRAQVDALGRGQVIVDGVDLGDRIAAWAVHGAHGLPTRIILELHDAAHVAAMADAVEVVSHDDVVAFLASIDPQKLDETVMDSFGPGDDGEFVMMAKTLDVLKEWASARTGTRSSS